MGKFISHDELGLSLGFYKFQYGGVDHCSRNQTGNFLNAPTVVAVTNLHINNLNNMLSFRLQHNHYKQVKSGTKYF